MRDPVMNESNREDRLREETKNWTEKLFHPGVKILRREGEEKGLKKAVCALYEQQTSQWPQLKLAVENVAKTEIRNIRVAGRRVKLQYNPARLVNVTASTNREEIAKRPCPLCPHNLHQPQKALPFTEHWLLVCNPLPILREHMVLIHRQHRPQTARGILKDILRFTELTGLATFYNGPQSGASIPDHLHIQATHPGQVPLVRQLPPASKSCSGILFQQELPQRIFLYGKTYSHAEKLFDQTIAALNRQGGKEQSDEPELNLAVFKRGVGEVPVVVVHPRYRHRPSCFYLKGEQRCMVSPGAADMSGLVILPRREDFIRLDGRKMHSIYEEISLPENHFAALSEELDERK